MSDRPLGRFLHLERPRSPDAGRDERDPPSPGAGRFEGVERPRADAPARAGAPPRTGALLDRFGPEPEPCLELAETEGTRPFTRCVRCGADSNSLVTECSACGVTLDTAEQREFSERFWAERQAESDREARAEAERRELSTQEEMRARRAMGEDLARAVGELERRRIDTEAGGFGFGVGDEHQPLGLRLLGLIPDARWQIGAALGAAALVLGLIVHGVGELKHRPWSPSLGVGILLTLVLVIPGGALRRRW